LYRPGILSIGARSGDISFFHQSNIITEAMIPFSSLHGWIDYVLKPMKLVEPCFQYLVTMNG
jgi:hypothetical protein